LVEVDLGEIDLGNSEFGKGDIQPLVPGDFAPPKSNTEKAEAPEADPAPPEEPADPETDDNQDDNAPTINKPVVKPPKPSPRVPDRPATPVTTPRPVTNPSPAPVTNPTPAPRRPTAVFTRPGGTGTGGNNADTYNNSRGQGTGGTGDQGSPDGRPGGTGTGPRLGYTNLTNKAAIRQMTENGTSFKGKVYLKLEVDENGNVSKVLSNTPSPFDREAKDFAATIARKMKFNAGADGRTAEITLNFNMGE
jgi:hypothetical protein